MKFRAIIIGLLLSVFSASAVARAAVVVPVDDEDERSQKVDRTVAVGSTVTVSLCVTSGNITVRGWDKNEVQATSGDAVQIELKRADEPGASDKIKKLEVIIFNKAETQKPNASRGNCQAYSDVELNIPRGATVLVQTRDGNIDIAGIASAYAGTQNGDINVERVSRSVEVGSIGGNICIKDSNGRVSATSAGGPVEAENLSPVETEDAFEIITISGDITLNQVTHKQLSTKTVSGNVSLTGPLAAGGNYGFNSFSGDVTLAMPSNSSFKLNAKISQGGDIITDFPLTLTTQATATAKATARVPPTPESPQQHSAAAPQPPATAPKAATPPSVVTVKVAPSVKGVIHVKPSVTVVTAPKATYTLRRVTAVHGTGDATINVASFSGTLHLQQN